MRTKNFLAFLCGVVVVSFVLIIFGQQRPASFQDIVFNTHKHIRNFQENLRDAELKTLVADEKYLNLLGFTSQPRIYPDSVWSNTSLPVIVTYVLDSQENQGVGFVNNMGKVLPNNTVLIYNLGLTNYGLHVLTNYCNNSRCQIVNFSLSNFPSHVDEERSHAYRPLVIQDALQRTGAVLFLECNLRFEKSVTPESIAALYTATAKGSGVLAWPMALRNAVTTLTHAKMFDYFRTTAENFQFLQMVDANALIVVNTRTVHTEIMLPWIQCTLTQDCIHPIGAQSAGCRFDKKPQYRYSGCHSYDASALNIVLGLHHKMDSSKYTYSGEKVSFKRVSAEKAATELAGLEQNATMEGKTPFVVETQSV